MAYSESATNASYTTFNEFSENQISPDLPCIFLMGARQGGKTSIERVVFHKMEAHQTLYSLQPTSEIYHRIISHNELIKFQILDFPGSFDFNDSEFKPTDFFKYCSVLLFVIDAQDRPYTESLNYILKIIEMSYSIKKDIKYEMLINKIDAEAFFTSESKLQIRRAIEQAITERLNNIDLLNDIHENISYYLTSIYDHSIFESLSEIVQKLLPISVHDFLKNILTSFVTKCDIEKAFIFDVVSKIYIATDANLMETDTISLCSDMIDLTVDVSGIYGSKQQEKNNKNNNENNNNNDNMMEHKQQENMMMMNENQNLIDANNSFDDESSSFITLQSSKQTILALRQVGKNLALVSIMKKPKNKGLLEYNIKCFKNAMNQLFQLLQKTKN